MKQGVREASHFRVMIVSIMHVMGGAGDYAMPLPTVTIDERMDGRMEKSLSLFIHTYW